MFGMMGGQQTQMPGQQNLMQGSGLQFPWQQVLQSMRQGQQNQSGGGGGLMSLLSALYPMLAGGSSMAGMGQAQKIGQSGLGMANQSPLSLFNPNYR